METPQKTPAEVWDALRTGAERACTQRPGQVHLRRFRIAGLPMEFTFAGTLLADRFTRSLSHLQVQDFQDGESILKILLWDEAATASRPPEIDVASAFPDAGLFADGDLARTADGRYCVYVNARSGTLLDMEQGLIVGYVRSAEELSPYETGKPLQPILFAWYSRHDALPVHAACVALNGEGVLIGGAGGSGKSTTSLACTMAGFSYLADDYTALPAPGAYQTAWSLYASLWLEEEHSRRFAHLMDHRIEGASAPDLKQPFALGDAHPDRMTTHCRVRAVILPRVAGLQKTRLTPADRAEAMIKMAPSSVLQLPFIQPFASMRRIADVLRTVPAFWLDLGTDLASIAPCVEEALRRAVQNGGGA